MIFYLITIPKCLNSSLDIPPSCQENTNYMKKIDSLLIRSFLPTFVMTFFIAMFVLVMQFLWKYIDDLVGKGLELSIIAELIFYMSARVVPLALPIAVLVTSIMTFGSLGEHYELAAFKSAGVSLMRIMRPVFLIALMLGIGGFLFANYILPKANLRFATLLYSVTRQRPAVNIKPGVYYDGFDNYIIKVGRKEEGSKIIEDVIIHNHTEGRGNTNTLLAKRGEMYSTPDSRFMIFKLYDGVQYDEPKSSGSKRSSNEFTRTEFSEYEMYLDLSGFDFNKTDESLFRSNQGMLTLQQLLHVADSLQRANQEIATGKGDLIRHFKVINNDTIVFDPQKAFWQAPNDTAKSLLSAWQLPPNRALEVVQRAKSNAQNMRYGLESNGREIAGNRKRMVRFLIEAHIKIVFALACIVLFFIGAPLGAIIRKGGLGLPMVVAILFYILFHILTTMGKKFAEEYALSPFQGMWLSTAILLPLGVFLTYKAATDSVLFNIDAYRTTFTAFFKKKKVL